MPIKKKPPSGAPKWMVSFADLQQLLLVFFILLYSMSSVDEEKFAAAMESIQMGLNGKGISQLDGGKKLIDDAFSESDIKNNASIAEQKAAQVEKEFKEVKKFLNESTVDGKSLKEFVKAFKTDEGVTLRIDDVLLFDSGKADVKSNSYPILKEIGTLIKKSPSNVRVEGHTDNVPIRSAKYSNNWELSASRATSVVNYLLDNNFISASKISISGYGEFRPVAPNTSDANKSKNRRVDIVLVSDFSEIEKSK